ncbi:topless-related protein 4-like isoform X1 [Syzygium oleosum]|uniref:topless-related protein 4-like isoform X1 n=2 Tax=Syzygium oleosum TaxID=219896 RepID=UPI0024BAE6F9|nr:topless-related protein 4-like isoform X1 [Syzygium oleosum]
MSSLGKELVLLILQFLNDENLKETAHRLEEESGCFFNMNYFEDVVTNGELDEVEKYLSGFTKFDDNRYSTKIFFEIRKQKYLEALDRCDDAKAAEILRKDLKMFSTYNEELFKEMTMLMSLNNFREIEQLSKYVDSKSARAVMLTEIKRLLGANPLFRDKLQFPCSKNSRLRGLINQSLNWQHQMCKYPRPDPEIKTLFVDHSCGTSNGAPALPPVMNPLLSCTPKIGGFSAPFRFFQLAPAPAAPMASLAGWLANPSLTPQPTASGCPIVVPAPRPAAPVNKRLRTPPYSPATDDVHIIKRTRPIEISDELQVNHPAVLHSSDDLPKTVVCNLNQGSAVKSMDFHPVQQTLLLVGTNIGDIRIWEIVSREMLHLRNFKVWDLGACSVNLQASLASEYTASVNRIVWSPDGDLFGVAYSKHIVQIYSYHGGNIQNHLEMDAHVGNVSDLAFSQLKEQLFLVTCGEDRTVKVWSAITGNRQYTFEGHESPVYSVCPHHRNNVQFIFSATVNGRIKVWLYDNLGPRLDVDAPGRSRTKIMYSADGTRVFSCGTNKEGESYLVEWIESEGAIKRTYHGLGKCSVGVVQFDTAKNRFLAAGDEFLIKIWDMDSDNVLTTINAEGGLPVSPCIKFNREGLLLAVSTSENAVKVLASDKVVHLLQSNGSRVLDASKVFYGTTAKGPTTGSLGASGSSAGTSIPTSSRNSPAPSIFGMNGDTENFSDVKTRTNGELENSQAWKLKEYNEQSQFQSLRLPDRLLPTRIVRMIYTSSGGAILALAYNAVHKLWKWQQNEFNLSGKATCAVEPKLWQPSSGIIMTNDISDIIVGDANPYFALSKNDSYLLSTSGGKISLFNMMTFKTMTTFMPPPPAATCLEFHPRDNNIVAIGMEDSSIQIFNVRVNEVESKFKGHQKRVTGLAFSDILNVLVSSGADAQLCVWSTDKWENLASKFLQIPTRRMSSTLAKTRVLFHQDLRHFLVVHETQIAIYEAPKLDCHKQWFPLESDAPITDAMYSCDGMSIYTSFEDGSVGIFASSMLQLKCRISATAYLPSNSSSLVYPVVVAAHPSEPNQFALGLTNGGVIVLEPPESEREWGTAPSVPNGSGPEPIQV